ncbi:MAG: beta-galactosidase, partial [Anaerolineae bacterium]
MATRQRLHGRPDGHRRALNRAVRALVLCSVAVMLSAPAQRLVVVGPPRQVVTLNGKMGVHTRLTDEVEEWKVQRSLEMVREMGAPWVVEYFPWGYYEPREGRYDWDHADLVIDHAVAQGLRVIARIDYVPAWARPEDSTARYLAEDHFPHYARFAAAFAEHFRGRVGYIVIWNEPNLAFEWGYRIPDPASYTELLRQSYAAIKSVAPEVQVLAAGLAPTMAPSGSEWGMDDLLFLQAMYDAGAAAHMDGLAMHAYGFTFP